MIDLPLKITILEIFVSDNFWNKVWCQNTDSRHSVLTLLVVDCTLPEISNLIESNDNCKFTIWETLSLFVISRFFQLV